MVGNKTSLQSMKHCLFHWLLQKTLFFKHMFLLTKIYERFFQYFSFIFAIDFQHRSFQSSKEEENDFAIDTEYLSSQLAKNSIYIWIEINIWNKKRISAQKKAIHEKKVNHIIFSLYIVLYNQYKSIEYSRSIVYVWRYCIEVVKAKYKFALYFIQFRPLTIVIKQNY